RMRAVLVRPAGLAAALVFSAAACSDVPTSPAPVPETAPVVTARVAQSIYDLQDWLNDQFPNLGRRRSSNLPLLVGAGDIAECYDGTPPPLPGAQVDPKGSDAEKTAQLLDQIPGTVITAGDNAYKFGTPFDFAECYHPTWGRHRSRTRPATGNHEYMTPGALGHYLYFGRRSAPPHGYYSYNVSVGRQRWHIVALNSTTQVYECYPPELYEAQEQVANHPWPTWWTQWGPPQLASRPTDWVTGRACLGDAAQQAWLIADLAKHRRYECTLVYFHHARFSSGQHGNHPQMQRIWEILYANGVDVVVAAHDHNYERFAPQNYKGDADDTYGIRQFVVGTGGGHLREVDEATKEPNSEVIIEFKFGVIAVALRANAYSWALVGVDRTILDSGSGTCHGRPPAASVPPLPSSVGG
ncbi:MAG: metallophosphoesterase, partial [Gemmatimonadota bacterium]|nr:metallophosphoesterase [Gemmatimonadota bacterium]